MEPTLALIIAVGVAFFVGAIVSLVGSGAGYIAGITAAALVFPVLIVTMAVTAITSGQPDAQTVTLVLSGLLGTAAVVMWGDFIISMTVLIARSISDWSDTRRRRASRARY